MRTTFVRMLGFATTLSLLPAFSYAQGTLYKWTDSHGIVHYTNTPTATTATAVDDILPPASKFDSPTPPPEIEKAAPPSPESKAAPDDKEGAVPGATGEGNPDSTSTDRSADGSATDNQQGADATPQLTPEQEQALKDSPM